MQKPKIAVLTGAGISAESGIKTFRDADGLWEGHDVMEVASPEGWHRNRNLVLDFYNQRRKQLKTVAPNAAHHSLVRLEEKFDVTIITQNVDDLHERAGSANIIHLHGELRKVRSTANPSLIYEWEEDCVEGDTCEQGAQLRPHIVWFGEAVPEIERAAALMPIVERVIIVGTSMQVYPAAGLIHYAPRFAPIHYVDPRPAAIDWTGPLEIIPEPATQGLDALVHRLLDS